jgi:hypothetical protein
MEILVLFLLVAVLVLWLLVWEPRAREARIMREKRAAEEAAQRAAERARLLLEREELLKSIRATAPDFILSARLEFEREYRAGGGEGQFGQEMSPLLCFGYRVGKTNGRTEHERQAILKYAMAADLNTSLPFLPSSYREEWGAPLTVARFNRVYQHICNMADLREGRRNFEVAVSHWRSDARWLRSKQVPLVEKFHAI